MRFSGAPRASGNSLPERRPTGGNPRANRLAGNGLPDHFFRDSEIPSNRKSPDMEMDMHTLLHHPAIHLSHRDCFLREKGGSPGRYTSSVLSSLVCPENSTWLPPNPCSMAPEFLSHGPERHKIRSKPSVLGISAASIELSHQVDPLLI